MTTLQLRSAQQRAISRAQVARLVSKVEPITASEWFVPSTSSRNAWYIVSRARLGNSELWSCTCKGSRNGRPCLHQASAWLFEQKLTVAGEPTPAIPPAPASDAQTREHSKPRITWTEAADDQADYAAIYGWKGAA